MRTRARTNQGGSIVSFILVGVVLLAALGGGVYYLAHRGSTDSANTPQTKISDNRDNAKEKSSNDSAFVDRKDSDKAKDRPAEAPKPTEPKPEDQPAEAPNKETPAPAATDPAKDNQPDKPDQNIPETGLSGQQHTLPQTGLADGLLGGGFVAVVAFAAVVYARSRRDLANEINQ